MAEKLYDETSIPSIIAYARKLESRTIDKTNEEEGTFGGQIGKKSDDFKLEGKGSFGNYLEEAYFGKKVDSFSQPDFPLAHLELKSSPLKTLQNNEVKVKERLVLNHFTFNDLDKEVFDSSHFIEKNRHILLVFYHYNKDYAREPWNQIVQLVDLWECIKEDEYQIRKDWETIALKVHHGKAHEISESDTLYLGACTKGATKEKSMQTQPHSSISAPGRAFCFKLQYINHIYQVLEERKLNRFKEVRFLKSNENFETKIKRLYHPYLKKDIKEIYRMMNKTFNPGNKGAIAQISREIVGLNRKEDNFYEFNASGIQLKTIRVEPNGKQKEHMSFKNIVFTEIVDEDWEESYFYGAVTSKFIIVLFKKDFPNQNYYLDRVFFWQIPTSDYPILKDIWEDTKSKIEAGDYNHFVSISDNRIAHVRPHGRDSSDLMLSPQGTMEKKKSFWLNRNYIQKKILDPIYKGEYEEYDSCELMAAEPKKE